MGRLPMLLRRVYEAVWNTRLDPGNFQRNVQESGAFVKRIEAPTGPLPAGSPGPGRPVRRARRARGLTSRSALIRTIVTRLDADTVHYAVTFEDPDLWTQPWTAEILMPPTEGAMFEFACHEGNTGMTATLEIARGEEAAVASR